eukprot:CAMPEP_0170543500 /NCGR_PEP_ID=MMETSP0211-20121228/2597_1 /TAXON_ID=311385 /ORGANISM="Pseudokeronopsis sp., Strain OXSARD2" /LENGTH=140 /DNA_ID=CAMNT_0010846897 /DNA_START=1412 /DNA_END=1834 /DNA_ORIENTATION=+
MSESEDVPDTHLEGLVSLQGVDFLLIVEGDLEVVSLLLAVLLPVFLYQVPLPLLICQLSYLLELIYLGSQLSQNRISLLDDVHQNFDGFFNIVTFTANDQFILEVGVLLGRPVEAVFGPAPSVRPSTLHLILLLVKAVLQ